MCHSVIASLDLRARRRCWKGARLLPGLFIDILIFPWKPWKWSTLQLAGASAGAGPESLRLARSRRVQTLASPHFYLLRRCVLNATPPHCFPHRFPASVWPSGNCIFRTGSFCSRRRETSEARVSVTITSGLGPGQRSEPQHMPQTIMHAPAPGPSPGFSASFSAQPRVQSQDLGPASLAQVW